MKWYGKDDETNAKIVQLIEAAQNCTMANVQLVRAIEELEALGDSVRWKPPVRFPEGTII